MVFTFAACAGSGDTPCHVPGAGRGRKPVLQPSRRLAERGARGPVAPHPCWRVL